MTKKVACVGEVMLEMTLAAGDTRLGVAGDTYNTAVYLKRLLPEADVAYVTLLGSDPVSDLVLNAIQSERLNTDGIGRRVDKTVGLYAVTVDTTGERSFTYWRSDSAARGLFTDQSTIALNHLSAFDLVYFSGITLAILTEDARTRLVEWARQYRLAGGLIAFDSNYRPAIWPSPEIARREIVRLWPLSDIAFPSFSDEMDLFGDLSESSVIDRVVRAGARGGCLKRGDQGPMSFDHRHRIFDMVAAEDVVDTTAAGDSFNAGYLAAHLKGGNSEQCMRAGHALASEVIRHRGAIIPVRAMPNILF